MTNHIIEFLIFLQKLTPIFSVLKNLDYKKNVVWYDLEINSKFIANIATIS